MSLSSPHPRNFPMKSKSVLNFKCRLCSIFPPLHRFTMDETDSRAMKRRTRTISDLTEEQIQQKRRIDRKAQRAFRQRTRDRISDLERHVIEIQESSIQQEAQLRHELQSLREQNKILNHRLASIAELAATSGSPNGEVADLHNHHCTYLRLPYMYLR